MASLMESKMPGVLSRSRKSLRSSPTDTAQLNIFKLKPPLEVTFFLTRSSILSNKRGTVKIAVGFTSWILLVSASRLCAKAIWVPTMVLK